MKKHLLPAWFMLLMGAALAQVTPSTSFTYQVFRGQIHILGGEVSLPGTGTEHHIYDPVTSTWSIGLILPRARQEALASPIDSAKFMVLAGFNSGFSADIYNAGSAAFYLHTRQ